MDRQGWHGERQWPLATRVTRRPNTQVGRPGGGGPFEVDPSNVVPAAAQPVRLEALESGAVERSEEPVLTRMHPWERGLRMLLWERG